MKNDVFLQSLGLARRAGKLLCGFDSVISEKTRLSAVLLASDLSPRTVKNLRYALDNENIHPVTLEYSMSALGYAIGKKPVGIIGIADDGFAKLLMSKLNGEVIE